MAADTSASDRRRLSEAVTLTAEKLLPSGQPALGSQVGAAAAVLVVLAAGKGTRFGTEPKCIQPILGSPLARHSIEAFRAVTGGPVVCVVGYRHADVAAALGPDNAYVLSANPAGGTAFAVYESFATPGLLAANPLVVVTMGDRVVPAGVFRRLLDTHQAGGVEAELSFLTARYEPPRHLGKGRVLRDETGRVARIVEEQDIDAEPNAVARQALRSLTEGNCPLYVTRAATLHRHLGGLSNANAQGQYYLTDIVASIGAAGGEIRTVTTQPHDGDYDLLCADVTRPADLALLESVLVRQRQAAPEADEVAAAAAAIRDHRPPGQIASIARQLQELTAATAREKLGWAADQPVAVGIAGGRLRIAFMHPDMGRFFGPAWQMPIGAGDAAGGEQIVVLAQQADDRRIHLFPLEPKYRESLGALPADDEAMYPGQDVSDWHSYEGFGTRMSETLLLSLGYFSDEEIEARRRRGQPLPPASLRVGSNMRRPFALVANALASLRTLREGTLGARVQRHLDRHHFTGLRLVCTGDVPQGGFSSSSAVTVATKNAISSLFELDVPPDVLVHLACQAEYGTGVRAGSLDQATEQKGRAGEGTLISSNPADNYRVIGTYGMPAERIQIVFPYSVERDRAAWRWSWGAYAESAVPGGPPTTAEIRKLTGKAAEIAAVLTRLPLDVDFFRRIEADLVADGLLDADSRRWIADTLLALPLLVRVDELRDRVFAAREWYAGEIARVHGLDAAAAARSAEAALAGLFSGWSEPTLRRGPAAGQVVTETGVPLRAMVAYLFGEVAKNFFLIHNQSRWIEFVRRSQQGDRSVALDPAALPDRAALETELDWERGLSGPERLAAWLERHGAVPYDFNQGLGDDVLSAATPPEFHLAAGGSFFRGLALIDLAEALLVRAFGAGAVAVRVNAAGQGDYFQAHVDRAAVDPEAVRQFLRVAFYRRFGIAAEPEFVAVHPGGGAVAVRLGRFDKLPALVRRLQLG